MPSRDKLSEFTTWCEQHKDTVGLKDLPERWGQWRFSRLHPSPEKT